MTGKKIILDLGCGKKKRQGAIGVDFSDRHDADVIHNLNHFPYPFENESVDDVYIDNCLEHLDEPMKVMEEIYRIVKPKGFVKVIVPYFRSVSAFTDPTHKTFYTVESFSYYDPAHLICQRYDYTDAKFSLKKIIFNEGHKKGFIKSIINKYANKNPLKYERFLSTILPLDEISYTLERL